MEKVARGFRPARDFPGYPTLTQLALTSIFTVSEHLSGLILQCFFFLFKA
jgi:hypothetical protein